MAKISGLGYTIAVDNSSSVAKTISNDITNFQFATPRGVQDTTGVDKSAHERILLLADFTVTFNGVFNDATDMSHDVFKTVPSTSVARKVTMTIDSKVLNDSLSSGGVMTLFTDYPLTRNNTGELTWAVPGSLSNGAVPTWA